jgi:hypothetical protein
MAWVLLCQALAMGALWTGFPLAWDRETARPQPLNPTKVFAAPPEVAVRSAPRAASLAPSPIHAPPPESRAEFPKSTINLSAIQLRFANDVGGRLPDVLRQQHGMLALLDKEDPTIARYLFQPPAWERGDDVVDVSSMLCLWMDPPEGWAVFRSLSRRYGIALNRYRAGALFDIGYRRCLQDAIGRASEIKRPGTPARVLAARLAFAADRPCGIEVLEVSLGNQVVRDPL